MSNNAVNIYDRIKQLSNTTSTSDIELVDSSIGGFSKFRTVYAHSGDLFYAITDGTDYEVGSGIFYNSDENPSDPYSFDTITRNPIRSSNSNAKVNFADGVKEVFVTYPANNSVYQGSGVAGFTVPALGGVAFWNSANMLNYSSNIVWDNVNGRLGIKDTTPSYAIDVGGPGNAESSIRASGFVVGTTGIFFQNDGSYPGGTQDKHFLPNVTDSVTGSDNIIMLSGVVNEAIHFHQQPPRTVFAGPESGCACPSGFPSFRLLNVDDMPNLSGLYAGNSKLVSTSGHLVSYIDTEITTVSGYLATINTSTLGTAISNFNTSGNSQLTAQSGEFDNFLISSSGKVVSSLSERQHVSVIGDTNAPTDSITLTNPASAFPFTAIETDSETTPSWDTSNYWYTVPYSGDYNISASLYGKHDNGVTPNQPGFYLVTSGYSNNVVTSGNQYKMFLAANGDSGAGGRQWNDNFASGDRIWIEASGKFYNFSSLSIHKM